MSNIRIRETTVHSILTPVSGFLKEAGFTHSLTPARNCTYGCTYCYVPTMRLFGGLKQEDWMRWGQFTTIKTNAPERMERELRGNQIIYCSPLVDPYQPAERERPAMPEILQAVIKKPPRVFVIQTRGPSILRDIDLLQEAARVTRLRISFSITTDRDDVRKRYEPHCEPNDDRLQAVCELREAGLEVYSTLAPLLPCNPERLVELAIDASQRDLIADPLHVRSNKPRGATTRPAALHIARCYGETEWFDPVFQNAIVQRMKCAAAMQGKSLMTGVPGFALLARPADVLVDDLLA